MRNYNNIYRPVWTCGRYDGTSQSAIFYNLLEGINYFFEDYSAVIIGEILSLKRNEGTNIADLSRKTEIPEEMMLSFLRELEKHGLVTFIPITSADESEYRKRVRKFKKQIRSDFPLSSVSDETALKSYAKRTRKPVVTAMLELTYRCSERCLHCYNPGASRNPGEQTLRGNRQELTLEDYRQIIDELYEEGVVDICLSGGDPFSYPHIWSIIKYLYEKDIAFGIYTNAQNLVGRCEDISKFYPSSIGVSLYSSVAEVHDKITGVNGSFRKSMSVIQRLHELSVPIEIKCCIMQQNFKTYQGVSEIAARYGATLQLECCIFDSLDGDVCASRYLRLTPEQMELTLRDPNNPLYIGKENVDYCANKKDLTLPACSAGNQYFCITPEGNLIPCSSFHAKIGNLKEKTLKELVESCAILKKWQELPLGQYEECGTHKYCDFCKLCPGLNFSEHGTVLKAAENNCYLAKIRYNLTEKIKSGNDPVEGTLKSSILLTPDSPVRTLAKLQKYNNYDKPLE